MSNSLGFLSGLISGVDQCQGNIECIRRLEGASGARLGGGPNLFERAARRAAQPSTLTAISRGTNTLSNRFLGSSPMLQPPRRGGGSEGFTNQPIVPGSGNVVPGLGFSGGGGDPLGLAGDCPGLTNVRIAGVCVDLGAALPGGDPLVTGDVDVGPSPNGFSPTQLGEPINGRFGVGRIPVVTVQAVRRCPKGMALGIDGVCYDGLPRNSPRREHRLGQKPLLSSGDRAAIKKAAAAARAIKRSKKSLNKASKALDQS